MTESRLDRLLKLIDTAPSPAYRRLAAKQLGNLVQSQPNQARTLLKLLDGMIFSKNWDTRIACSYAIEYIFTALPTQFASELEPLPSEQSSDLLTEMDLSIEIRSRKTLVSSAGSEFDLDLTISAAERLKISRANMKKTLGLDDIAGMEELEKELVRDEDFSAGVAAQQQRQQQQQQPSQVDLEKLSARERIVMKRKARFKAQAPPPPTKQVKKSCDDSSLVSTETIGTESFESIESDALWLCEKMKEKLLNPNWQIRHGALLGLRAVLGRGLPILTVSDSQILSECQESWIDFLLGDILLVLGLDRFGDYVGEQVVSPVKETAAQLLALIYKRLYQEKRTCLITRHIRALMNFELWQVRHAGLLGLKYILVNVEDIQAAGELGDRVVDLLNDGDEDVRSISAEVLCTLLSSGRQSSIDLERTFNSLKILLKDLDESSPSVAPILDLLGQLVGYSATFVIESKLLLPFLRHSSVKVRKQVIKVLGAVDTIELAEVEMILVQLIQSMAIELEREINDSTLSLALDLITISSDEIFKNTPEILDNLFEIVTCPPGQPYSKTNFKFINGTGPAGYDFAFKIADMMLLGEEEAIVQRINVSLAISGIRSGSVSYDWEKQKGKLLNSSWCIHHLIHRWIFGFENGCQVRSFNELSPFTNSYQIEFSRFCQLIGVSGCSNDKISTIEEFNMRKEKSVEELNQLSTVENCRLQVERESHKLNCRHFICGAELKSSDSNGKITDAFLDGLVRALKIETIPRLQELYASELKEKLETKLELINEEFLIEIGNLMNLEENSPNRSGKFVFKEFSKSKLIVSKCLKFEINLNFLVALLREIKEKPIAQLLINENFYLFEKLQETRDEYEISIISLAFSLLVRLEILCNETTTSTLLENFLHEFLFSLETFKVFPVILGILSECSLNCDHVIIPLVPVFLKRTLSEINDSDALTRKLASKTFSQLIKMAPLSASAISGFSEETEKLIIKCREFLEQLQGPSSSLPDFHPPCKLNVQMRPYQQAGLNWLAFLRRFNLHGALCDDMGLGKTLQTLSIIASDHFELKQHQQQQLKSSPSTFIRSLIVCPTSLTGHWDAEIRQYCPTLEAPLLYVGPSALRHYHLQDSLTRSEIVITSYDVLRSDSNLLTDLSWNYCVLDEGHLIKNPKTKLSAAVRGLKAKRRLLLSGTPIQNNLLELWALFEFLLPGYLGNEKEFTERYAKPILILQHQQSANSSDGSSVGKWTQRDFDEAEGKLQSLHKQVLPFILRRMKEDVLSDLPPKIIQDYKCPMSSIQKILYEGLLKGSKIKSEISKFVKDKFIRDIEEEDISLEASSGDADLDGSSGSGGKTHVFQVLQYLRKLCVHPSLVMTPDHPLSSEINSELQRNNLKMNDLGVAPKFQMLKEILVECGLGSGDDGAGGVCGDHRILIFAQHKSTLDLIEEIVFKAHLPQISYLRLDGGVEASSRYPIVSKFNTDMTIDVLLLTTHIGGLGLNLTTADTVIFMDPDWNPMKDLQAMDRAHRLGQKRVVNVYRLLLRDTLEDRIMSLQRWKTKVAGTVISQQNSEAVNHENLLDLFDDDDDDDDEGEGQKDEKQTNTIDKKSRKKIKSNGPDWHVEDDSDLAKRETEYAQEFNK